MSYLRASRSTPSKSSVAGQDRASPCALDCLAMDPDVIYIDPPGAPKQGTMAMPRHKGRTLSGKPVTYVPFFPCCMQGEAFLQSSRLESVEYWEHPCSACGSIFRFRKEGAYWSWEPIGSYTSRDQPFSVAIDPVLVLERLEREARERDGG